MTRPEDDTPGVPISGPLATAPNRLGRESSAYLRQHMHNPVDWYPWGAEALLRARKEDRPLLVSIGYSACHWCHVMERESFEDPATAAIMNEHFVNIKVDREERPDVDQLYMDATLRMLGRGGWPLTLFCTPDGRPFYCGTYFPDRRRGSQPSFRDVLLSLNDAFEKHRGEVEENADRVLEALAARPMPESGTAPPGLPQLREAAAQIMSGADTTHGGFGEAPKFPTPPVLELLLAALDYLPADEASAALEHVARTCQGMANRGLYDHLGGGFHRYCVDAAWTIPHFEKMLYDQGLLMRVYSEMFRRSEGNPEFAWPLRESAAYLRREMTAPEGGLYASQDADSEGEEGRYYVWTPAQVEAVLGPEAEPFQAAFGVTPQGNFGGGTTHLIRQTRGDRSEFERQRSLLATTRAERVAPATDCKRVAAWNGFAISGLARAGSLLGDADMLSDAARAFDFVLDRMVDGKGRLFRVYDEAGAHVPAFLDDHAALLEAALDLYRAGIGDRCLDAALQFAEAIRERFFDATEGDLFLTPSDAEPLIHRPRSDHDGATPHAAGLAVGGLLRVAELSGSVALREVAERTIESHAILLERAPHAFPTMIRAVALQARGLSVVVVVGALDDPATLVLADRARREFLPEDAVVVCADGRAPEALDPTWLAGRAIQDGSPAAFVCRGRECSLPITDPDALPALAGRSD